MLQESRESAKEKILYDQLNLRVSIKLHHEFKLAVVKKSTSESEVIRDFMQRYVSEVNKTVVY